MQLGTEQTPSTADSSVTRPDHITKVRESLDRVCPGLTAFADGLRERFGQGVKIEGVQGLDDGKRVGMGRMAEGGDLWGTWPEGQR